jgi:hypothetical protein
MNSSDQSVAPGFAWLAFALLTVGSWGLYGIFLHAGQVGMHDSTNGRYKAFLWVGIAYFLTAVLAPMVLLWLRGAGWDFPLQGVGWSLLAGLLGAAGAFGVLLAFGARGTPPVVMSIVFAGAPIVNSLYSLAQHPPAGGWRHLPLPFVLGIVLAAAGGCLVTLYKPAPAPTRPSTQASMASGADVRLAQKVIVPQEAEAGGKP